MLELNFCAGELSKNCEPEILSWISFSWQLFIVCDPNWHQEQGGKGLRDPSAMCLGGNRDFD